MKVKKLIFFFLAIFLFSSHAAWADVIEDSGYIYFFRIDLDLISTTEDQGFLLMWETTQPMTTEVEYGETPSMGVIQQGEQSITITHSVKVQNLRPKTSYWYRPRGKDSSGTLRTAPTISFITNPDLLPPTISEIKAVPKSTSALISWLTSEQTACTIFYGETLSYGKSLSSGLNRSHSLSVSNLITSTTYHYSISCQDQGGNKSSSSDKIFTTTTPPVTITSKTHPNQDDWYRSGDVVLSWEKPKDAITFNYTLTKSAEKKDFQWKEELVTEKSFENLADGVWDFYLRVKNIGGYSDTTSYKIKIDHTPPEEFVSIASSSAGPYGPLPIFFSTKDTLSGLEKYEGNIDGGDPKVVTSPYEIDFWEVKSGEHKVKIKAIDKAGNFRESEIEIEVPLPPAPQIIIENFKEGILNYDQPMVFGGTAPPNSKVKIEVLKTNFLRKQKMFEAKTDKNGKWRLEFLKSLKPGQYQIAATTIAGVNESLPSKTIEFKVVGPWWVGKEIYLAISTAIILIILFLYRFYPKYKDKFPWVKKEEGEKLNKKTENFQE